MTSVVVLFAYPGEVKYPDNEMSYKNSSKEVVIVILTDLHNAINKVSDKI